MALLQEIKVPLLAVNDTTLTVVEIAFPNGQKVKSGQPVMVFETSKTTYDAEAGVDGYIQYLCEAGRDYEVNHIVARIFSEAEEAKEVFPANHVPLPGVSSSLHSFEPRLSHANRPDDKIVSALGHPGSGIRRPADWKGETLFSREAGFLIESSGIDRGVFKGKDFVTKKDVENVVAVSRKVLPPLRSSHVHPAPDTAKMIVEKLSRNKKKEIEYLGEVQSAGLTSTINVNVETEDIFEHINQSLTYFKNSLLPVILYETGRLLLKYPLLNGFYTGEGIAVYRQINVGFAIDLDKGLKVLKIANTDSKTIDSIEEEILSLSGRYLDDTLAIDDLTDITFTVTDLSAEGVAFFRPLINMMNSAILGVSAIDEKLGRCILSMTFDHRVTEGKPVALFLRDLKGRLESYRIVRRSQRNQNIVCFKCLKTLQEDLAGTGFVKCITPEGEEGMICQACLKGF